METTRQYKIAYTETAIQDMEEKAEISDRAQRVLEDVDEITRKILVLHYWSGYSFKEIAVIIGMKDTAVRKRHSRAIKKIQTLHAEVANEDKKEVLLLEAQKWNTT